MSQFWDYLFRWNGVLDPPKRFGSTTASKMGLAAACFAFAVATANAFQERQLASSTTRKERLPRSSTYDSQQQLAVRFSPFQLQTKVKCEAQPEAAVDSSLLSSSSELLSRELSSSGSYERIDSPTRMESDSHAVGGLFDPRKIARYEVYKRLDDDEHHVVTALVDFGDGLDGHPGVVHGGILALALDDIFGFAFGAIGVPKAVTANLAVDFRAPVPASTAVAVKVYLERRENRKIYFKGEIASLDGGLVYCESSCLYIIPRSVWAEMGN